MYLDAAPQVADLVRGPSWDEHCLVLVLLKVPGVDLRQNHSHMH